ncbi:unnamed protein product [Lactuca virosa]|uniref:Uncharacterized protein n=1 Tax=Lactuca virosa TaxID=75947 RepID=A0AAU9NGM8_9ASTR|nr:unnamed protein product [Lactuca virosa]
MLGQVMISLPLPLVLIVGMDGLERYFIQLNPKSIPDVNPCVTSPHLTDGSHVLKSGQRVTNRVTQACFRSQADSVTCHCAMLNIPKQNISLNMKKKTSTTCPEKTVLVLDQLSAPNYYEFRAPNYYEFKRLQDLQ